MGSVGPEVAHVLVEALGAEGGLAFARASLDPASHVLRAHALRTTPAALCAELGGTTGSLPYAIRLPEGLRQPPAELDAVGEGRASPQDEASMQVVEHLGPEPGEIVLDVCAAPGAKTCHAAERMQDRGRVLAHDRLPERLARVRENAARLGLAAVEILRSSYRWRWESLGPSRTSPSFGTTIDAGSALSPHAPGRVPVR